MLVVDIVLWEEIEPLKTKVICTLGWDDKKENIIIVSGDKKFAKELLKDKFLDKRNYPEKLRSVEAKQGKNFIRDLPYALTGTRCWAAAKFREIK